MINGQRFTNLNETVRTVGQPILIVITIENAGVNMREIVTQTRGVQSEDSKKHLTEKIKPEKEKPTKQSESSLDYNRFGKESETRNINN